MYNKVNNNLRIGYGLSILLLLISSLASYLSINSLVKSTNMVNHTNTVILELENTLSLLKDAETGQRGYLLTGLNQFLDPYKNANSRISGHLQRLKSLISDNPAQVIKCIQLQETVNKRLKHLAQVIESKNQQKHIDPKEMLIGRSLMLEARAVVLSMENTERILLAQRTKRMDIFQVYTPALIIIAALLSLIITIISYMRAQKDLLKRAKLYNELKETDDHTAKRLAIIEDIAKKIALGDFSTRVEDENDADSLGSLSLSLNKMAESLDLSFKSLSDKEWLQAGIASLNERMIGEIDTKPLTQAILEHIIKYTNSSVGALYILQDEENLELTASYALASDYKKQIIKIGDGIVGQCATNKEKIHLSDIQETDMVISFASSTIRPNNIIAFPILFENHIKGVIELGSVNTFSNLDFEYFDSVSHSSGIVIHTAQNRSKLQELLEETQAQTEELQAQHSELENLNTELEAQAQKLQASEEELRVQQEELLQANQELEERSKVLEEKNQLIVERNLDIQKKSEELEQSTKYKSEFLANMSHELRTPLNSILLLSRLLSENTEQNLNEDQIEYGRVIHSSGNGLLSLIDEILDLSKIEAGKMELEYQNTAVKDIMLDLKSLFGPIAKEKSLELNMHVDSDIPEIIRIDKMRFEQVIKNLLSNALKFTARGSVLMNVTSSNKRGFINFSVKDTGIGIAKDKQNHVFEAFQQADGSTRRKYGGTGLGLSISRELVKLQGGELLIASEPGKGSEFTVVIPIHPELIIKEDNAINEIYEDKIAATIPEEIAQPKSEINERERKKYLSEIIPHDLEDDRNTITNQDKVILIVEDDTNFAKALLEYTRKNKYKGIVAVRGDQGITLAQQYKPVAILLDIQLPIKDGWEVMEELKANPKTKHIPVHIMSSMQVKRESLLKGAIDFINKPVALEQMQHMFASIENALTKDLKKVLIIEENSQHARALAYFLDTYQINSEIKESIADGVNALQKKEVDCVILDMGIPDMNAYVTLETVKKTPGLENLPIIIFTGKNLSKAEESKIKLYADSIVMKTAHSYQRILDEVALFLHLVEEKHPLGNATASVIKNAVALNEILKNKTVLIADDDVRNIFSLTKALEQLKMKVVSATDGKEALIVLKENPQTDVVLMDMMMPEMDGYESIIQIRRDPKFKSLPILAVTAKAMVGDREKCINAGASDYISKPVDIDQLISLLRVWLYDKYL
ncbi:Signal transduction histidine kinase [Arcticibacter svalbardensis MN12-7]|uniref:histidine kinase n=2 Tax=Arcticibacter TaxID=1288026 RepID=R9H4F5_9SPHI|nr:Signal transduction histidine kinase [Arcticibacter svalbardensis MN12-7]